MKIVYDFPPNYAELVDAFNIRRHDVIFTWGDKLYNPGGIRITPALMAHEKVHCQQQTTDEEKIRAWWRRAMDDDRFRLEQELVAHQVEYAAYCRWKSDRNMRAQALLAISQRLAGPLYGNLMTVNEARRAILNPSPRREDEGTDVPTVQHAPLGE